MEYVQHDGGRSQYFSSKAGDCVCRAIAIATKLDYQIVYDILAEGNATQRVTSKTRQTMSGKRSASKGIYTHRKWFKDYMKGLGFEWESFAQIGKPSTIRLDDSFPKEGTFIATTRRHYVAIVDGILYDSFDSRMSATFVDHDGTVTPPRPHTVYGVWKLVK